jgi:hypothetical protein
MGTPAWSPRRREAYLKQYVDRLSGEPARHTTLRVNRRLIGQSPSSLSPPEDHLRLSKLVATAKTRLQQKRS